MNKKTIEDHAGKLMSEIHNEWVRNELDLRYNKRMQLAGKGDMAKRAEVIAECSKKKEYFEGAVEVLRDIVEENKS